VRYVEGPPPESVTAEDHLHMFGKTKANM